MGILNFLSTQGQVLQLAIINNLGIAASLTIAAIVVACSSIIYMRKFAHATNAKKVAKNNVEPSSPEVTNKDTTVGTATINTANTTTTITTTTTAANTTVAALAANVQSPSILLKKFAKFYLNVLENPREQMRMSNDEVDEALAALQYNFDMIDGEFFDTKFSGTKWHDSNVVFGKLVQLLHKLLIKSLDKSSQYFHNAHVNKISIHALKQFAKKIPDNPRGYPWGANWYQFSVDYTTFVLSFAIIHYLQQHQQQQNTDTELLPSDVLFLEKHYQVVFLNYLKSSPTGIYSIGHNRNETDAINMAIPYIGGRLLLNKFDADDPVLKYLRDFYNHLSSNPVSGNGFYNDGSYVAHSNVRAFGHLKKHNILFIAKFMDFPHKILANKLDKLYNSTEHPVIPLHHGPWFTRTNNMGSIDLPSGAYGFSVMDHIRAVSCKTHKWTIGFNGQHKQLAFYESDQDANKMALYWIFARRFMYLFTDNYIYEELLPHYSGVISYMNNPLILVSSSGGTESFLPKHAECVICQVTGAVAMLNKFTITRANWSIKIEELNLITEQGGHFYYNIIDANKAVYKNKPVKVGINFGSLLPDQPSLLINKEHIGEAYEFIDSTSFIYTGTDGNSVQISKVQHPQQSDVIYDSVQLQANFTPKRFTEYGFSTLHNVTRNELIKVPDITQITTDRYIVYRNPKHPSLLYLFDSFENKCAVSKDMGSKVNQNLSIPVKALQDSFSNSNFNIPQAITEHNMHNIAIVNGDRYQMLINNVTKLNKY